jgi:hypothetical protein
MRAKRQAGFRLEFSVSTTSHDNSGDFDADSENILFFGDPNLGVDRGWRVFSAFFPKAKKLIWKRGTPKAPLHRQIRCDTWLFAVSFYNDFIFSASDFPHLGLPLNLHPSLPVLRGVGHDHIPLIENHPEHGGTLHYMEPPPEPRLRVSDGVDTGRIIRIKKQALSPTASYGDIRALNQQIMLEMLADLCKQMLKWGRVPTAHRELCRESDENSFSWSERYIDYPARQTIIEEMRQADAGHRVFNQNRSIVEDGDSFSAPGCAGLRAQLLLATE